MSVIKLRKEVINSLANVDERFLRMVRTLYRSYAQNEVDTFENLPTEIQDILIQSRKSIKQGKVFSHKEVMNASRSKYNITE